MDDDDVLDVWPIPIQQVMNVWIFQSEAHAIEAVEARISSSGSVANCTTCNAEELRLRFLSSQTVSLVEFALLVVDPTFRAASGVN